MKNFGMYSTIGELERQNKNTAKLLNEKDKEIERLQRQKEELQINGLRQETLFKLEIERLNNIINELEKWLNDRSEFTNFGELLDKLQELKGEDKE